VVSNLNDSGAGSLREAITAALASPEDDIITFSVSGTINLLTTLPNLTSGGALTIDGTGQDITISGPGQGCSTDPSCRVFTSQITLNLINLTVTNGYVNSQGGGIFNNESTLNVTNCTVSGNHSGNGGGAIYTLEEGTTTIINSAVSDNYGGGIGAAGNDPPTLTVTNSTVSNNDGNGIGAMGNVAVIHSTIVSNTIGVYDQIFMDGSFTLTNTIVASNTTNCQTMMSDITDGGYNLVWGDTTCPGTFTNADPKLFPLADNGGPTWTYALDNGSAALNQIATGVNGCGTTYTTDQRGEPRPYGTKCEIGAWEGPPPTAGPQLALTKSVNPPSAKPGEAITYTISFSNTGAITATNVAITDSLSSDISNPAWSSSGVTLTPIGGQTYVWTAPDLLQGQGGVITITGALTKPLAAGAIPNTVTLAVSGTVQNANANLTVENVAPVADAGDDQSKVISSAVTLNGSGADDNGDTLTYGWTQTGGSPIVTLSDPTAQQPTFDAPDAETVLTFTLTVTDTGALTGTDEVVITVAEESQLTINKTGSGNGSVMAAYGNGSVLLPGTAQLPALITGIAPGAVVTLTAIASPTSTFAGWSGALTGDANPTTIVMDADKVVTATFNANADLSISKTSLMAGMDITYTLVARNLGPAAANGAVISDTMPANVTAAGWVWTCAGTACSTASGTGNLNQTLGAFPVGGVVTYTLSGALQKWNAVANTAEITPPAGISDPNASNNRSTASIRFYFFPIIFKN